MGRLTYEKMEIPSHCHVMNIFTVALIAIHLDNSIHYNYKLQILWATWKIMEFNPLVGLSNSCCWTI